MSEALTPQRDRLVSPVKHNPGPGLDDLLVSPELVAVLAPQTVVRLLAQCATVEGVLVAKLRRLPTDGFGSPSASPGHAKAPMPKTVDSGNDPEYLSIRELAERIPYTEGTIRNLMSKGQLRLGEHYVKPRGRVMFRWAAVRAWLDTARERAG
jgi:hypothetical protein